MKFKEGIHGRWSLNAAFESGMLSYSHLPVDLYNSGVNQILSEAANRGHVIYHFRTKDVFSEDGYPLTRVSALGLPPGKEGGKDALHRIQHPQQYGRMPD